MDQRRGTPTRAGERGFAPAHGWEGRLYYIGKLEPVRAEPTLWGIDTKASEWSIHGWSYFREPKVTHWMPLPEPPSAEGDADT